MYCVEWEVRGRSWVDADDPDEAEDVVRRGVENMDASDFDGIEVDGAEITSTVESAMP